MCLSIRKPGHGQGAGSWLRPFNNETAAHADIADVRFSLNQLVYFLDSACRPFEWPEFHIAHWGVVVSRLETTAAEYPVSSWTNHRALPASAACAVGLCLRSTAALSVAFTSLGRSFQAVRNASIP